MKVIFLDIDGVLNSERNMMQNRILRPSKDPSRPFDKEAVKALNFILDGQDVKIVISSTWRFGRSFKQLDEILTEEGVLPGRLIGKTPPTSMNISNSLFLQRNHEIKMWLNGHPEVSHWVVLDDDEDAGPDHFIKVDSFPGLTLENAKDAIKWLTKN